MVTTSQDKDKYGVSLKAEPDHLLLGKRLKGDFKKVTQSIRQLTDAQLVKYRDSGEIVVDGHTLGDKDLRLSYTVAEGDKDKHSYEAHSDKEVGFVFVT